MPPKKPKQPKIADIIQDLLRDVTEPIPVNALIESALQRFESKAKNPRSTVRTAITYEAGQSLVFIDRERVLPANIALRGMRFCIPLSQLEIDEGGFAMDYLRYYVANTHEPMENRVKLIDANGTPIPTRKNVYVKTHKDPEGEHTQIEELFDVKDWLHAHRAKTGDYLVVIIEDRDTPVLRLEFERASDADEAEIARRDQQLCDILFDMLEHARDERIYPHEAIATALARLPDREGYAGNHWRIALQTDGRMSYDNFATITYPDAGPSPFERLLTGYEFEGKPFTHEQGAQVYRFSARMTSGKRKPVTIEILGRQTFFEFDQLLRKAFRHDTEDHLGGFWLLIPRASGRYREVEIGACAPDADYDMEGSASGLAVAGVDFSVGSRMQYVYDFGDWIEHELVLEAIETAETKVRYPRMIAQ